MKQSKTTKKLFSLMSNLHTHYHFKLDFQNVDQHTGGKWLIHGTKRRKDNQLQSLKLQGAVSIRKTVLPGMAIPTLKIRRPDGRLIFNMEIAIRR